MASDPILSICIVSFNTAELTVDAVRSACQDIERSSLANRVDLIVVDNNSQDDSVDQLKRFAKQTPVLITILKNTKNVGFSVANNQAIRESAAKYILLLNSDTYVQPLAIQRLIETMEETVDQSTAQLSSYPNKIDRLGIIAATLVYPDGTLQHQGGSRPTLWSLANHMCMFDDIPLLGKLLPSTQHTGLRGVFQTDNQLQPRDWVAGTAMLLRREMLEEIGTLDEKIFMYAEDMELCVRAKHHHWDIAIHPTAYITHHQVASSSSERAIVGEYRGYKYIWSKHRPLTEQQLAVFILKAGAVLRKWLFGTMGRSEKAEMYQKVLAEL
ncbi:MAG: glycosyltransferase family 2 protein [Patescibacteria group bacterium]